jgi:hypothetical protein
MVVSSGAMVASGGAGDADAAEAMGAGDADVAEPMGAGDADAAEAIGAGAAIDPGDIACDGTTASPPQPATMANASSSAHLRRAPRIGDSGVVMIDRVPSVEV